MWLRDALPHELPGTRVLTYGYDTRLAGSHSFQNLEDVALKFRRSLKIALGDRPSNRPLIFIAHSLGGLVLKQALIQMASGSVEDVSIFYSTYGILFFGVPNQGMDISSLLAMVGSQPNLPFLTMLSKDAGILQELIEKFRTVFEFKDSEIISFYETHASRTARNDGTGKWSMSGDHAVLVDRFSARSGRPWEENHSFLQPIGRNHSDMVKYSEYDDDVGIVCDFLTRLAKPAPLVIRDRIKRLESVTTSAPPNARSLASRPQPQGKQAAIEQQKIPIAAKQRTEKLARSTGNQSKEKERSNHGQHEGDSNTIIEKTKMPGPSEPRISENKEYEKMLTSEGFDTGTEPSRKDGLLWAARTGHVLLTEYLLDRDTSIEAKDPEGWTPLHWAAFTANLELFHRLLFQGAMFHARTNDGETLLHLASYYNERHPKISHIEHYIGSSSDREAIALELLDRGLFVDEQDKSGGTPLLFAAACGLENMIELLASKGADVQATGVKRSSALHYASRCNRLGAVDVLLNEGTNPLSLDEQGKSPLDLALFYGHEEVAKRLKGARLDAR